MLNGLGVIYPDLKRRKICKKGIFHDFQGYFTLKITLFLLKNSLLCKRNIFPLLLERGDLPMLGASAAVIAVLVGLATYIPNHEIFLFGIFTGIPCHLKLIIYLIHLQIAYHIR